MKLIDLLPGRCFKIPEMTENIIFMRLYSGFFDSERLYRLEAIEIAGRICTRGVSHFFPADISVERVIVKFIIKEE